MKSTDEQLDRWMDGWMDIDRKRDGKNRWMEMTDDQLDRL